MTLRRALRPRPDLPGDAEARQAKFAKPQFRQPREASIDTTGLTHRKLHPLRDRRFLDWLRRQPCAVKGAPGHVCWNENKAGLNDPAHTRKLGLSIKAADDGAFTLCRAAHREQEPNHDAFDAKYGINRHEIAARQRAQYLSDIEKKGLTR